MPIATGREMGILKIVSTLQEVDAATISRKLVVSEKYVETLCQALVEDGYLQETKGVYKISPAGEKALRPYKIAIGEKYIHA